MKMKKLERPEMKSLKGGKIMMQQNGWQMTGSQCYCDYTYTYPNGSTYTRCYEPCASACCNAGGNTMPCSLEVETAS
jgi:hypothetical protein